MREETFAKFGLQQIQVVICITIIIIIIIIIIICITIIIIIIIIIIITIITTIKVDCAFLAEAPSLKTELTKHIISNT